MAYPIRVVHSLWEMRLSLALSTASAKLLLTLTKTQAMAAAILLTVAFRPLSVLSRHAQTVTVRHPRRLRSRTFCISRSLLVSILFFQNARCVFGNLSLQYRQPCQKHP